LRFTEAAGTLKAGANSKGIDVQLFRTDHKKLKQSDDRSFDAEKTSYKESETVTAYNKGVLAWGEEPDGTTPQDAKQKKATVNAGHEPLPAAPEGVLFDTFAYLAPTYPALAKPGWRVRTSKGGPGVATTCSAAAATFPSDAAPLAGGQAPQLRASPDGTEAGTKQGSLGTAASKFREG